MSRCGCSEVLARCLVNRGLEDLDEIEAYINPQLSKLHNPLLLKDMEKACLLLSAKIKEGKKIRIIGDYDVDGIIATYILYQALKKVGAQVDYDIPDRVKDGYGINVHMVEEAKRASVDTILTCDNGIAALDPIERAKELRMTVIVTDHHDLAVIDEELVLPAADAIVNPKQPDCSYPFAELCGAAVAYKLALAILQKFEFPNIEQIGDELLSYVAIATVCDVMDLVGENRIIVKYGLNMLQQTDNMGLLALMDACGIEKEHLSAYHLGFVLGPCLNASGRLDIAKKGLALLLSQSQEEARSLAHEVRELNELRKNMTADGVERAVQLIEETSLKDDKVLVVYLKDCHESIAGIIAGRLKDRYYKPTLVLTDAEGCVKGSARSIESYNVFEELSKCRHLLNKVGGHPMAAGFSLPASNVEPLREQLNKNTSLTDEMLVPKVTIDVLLPLGYLNEELVEELKLLEPFGKGNEKPLFAEKDLTIKSARVIGKNGNGIMFKVVNMYGKMMDALYFGDVEQFFNYLGERYGFEEAENLRTGRGTNIKLTVTYYPRINEYNGYRSMQILIQNYR
ncbi:MAG: single-stranded-DNA-specific exonuclease RecJ [Clostridiales bacterium]|nr:single-stranded-DNA-specific exonuclease RecJ [Clostridiales bacterium]